MEDTNYEKLMSCCICGRLFNGTGNDPYPVKKFGRCCDMCNEEIVIPARTAGIMSKK